MSGLTMKEETGELGMKYRMLEEDERGIEQVYMDQYKRSKTSPLEVMKVQFTVANPMNQGRHSLAHRMLVPSFRRVVKEHQRLELRIIEPPVLLIALLALVKVVKIESLLCSKHEDKPMACRRRTSCPRTGASDGCHQTSIIAGLGVESLMKGR